MYNSIDLFRVAGEMAQHSGAQQAKTARNIAHADTPGYAAVRTVRFADVMQETASSAMHRTRPGHMSFAPSGSTGAGQIGAEPAPNGNSVSLETEMMNATAFSRDHNKALAIYRHGLTMMRTVLGRS